MSQLTSWVWGFLLMPSVADYHHRFARAAAPCPERERQTAASCELTNVLCRPVPGQLTQLSFDGWNLEGTFPAEQLPKFSALVEVRKHMGLLHDSVLECKSGKLFLVVLVCIQDVSRQDVSRAFDHAGWVHELQLDLSNNRQMAGDLKALFDSFAELKNLQACLSPCLLQRHQCRAALHMQDTLSDSSTRAAS